MMNTTAASLAAGTLRPAPWLSVTSLALKRCLESSQPPRTPGYLGPEAQQEIAMLMEGPAAVDTMMYPLVLEGLRLFAAAAATNVCPSGEDCNNMCMRQSTC
jgi:hypothetical protein